MALKIDDDFIALEIGGCGRNSQVTADGWWLVTYWSRYFTRNQAITALTIRAIRRTGYDNDHPVVIALREKLR